MGVFRPGLGACKQLADVDATGVRLRKRTDGSRYGGTCCGADRCVLMALSVSAAAANDLLDEWLADNEPWEGPGAEAANAQHEAGQPAVQAWFAEKRRLFERGDVLHLPELDEACQHETGWTLGPLEEWLIRDVEGGYLYELTLALD